MTIGLESDDEKWIGDRSVVLALTGGPGRVELPIEVQHLRTYDQTQLQGNVSVEAPNLKLPGSEIV